MDVPNIFNSLKKCVEVSSNKIEEQKEKAEVKRKEDNQKIIQVIEPKTKNKKRSGNRI